MSDLGSAATPPRYRTGDRPPPPLGEEGSLYAEAIADTIREALLVLTPDLRVRSANARFYELFGGVRPEAEGHLVYDLRGGQWDIPELRRLFEDLLPHTPIVEGYDVCHAFSGLGERTLLLNAHRIDHAGIILVAIEDVTEPRRRERERIEEALIESREMFQLVLDHIPQGVFWKDREGRYLGVNAVAARASGFENPTDLVGLTEYDLPGVTPEQVAFFREKDLEVMESGGPVLGIDEPLGRPDGSTAWLRTSKVPLRSADGRVVGVLGTWEDVTERKEIEKRLRQSEAAFRQLADAMPQLVWTATPDGRVDYYNRRADLYDGLSRQDRSWNWVAVVHPEDIEQTEMAWQRAVGTGRPYEVEHRIRLADGSYRWHLSRGVPARAASGRIVRWFGTATDIHALKTAEEALRQNEERLRRAQGAAQVGTWDQDLVTGEVVWSEGVFRLVGLSPEGGVPTAEAWEALLHPDDREQVARRLQAAFEAGGAYENEFRIVRPSGEVVWIAAQGSVLHDEAGRAVRLLGVNFDITARKQAEEALRRSNETLEARVAERTVELERANRELIAARDRFRTAFHASPIAASIMSLPAGRLLDLNTEYARFFGFEPSELLGRSKHDASFWSDPAERDRLIDEMKAEGRVRNREVLIRTQAGEERAVLASVEPIELGGEPCALSMFVDITERKRAEERIQELASALTLAEQRERQRISEVLHDDLQQMLIAMKMRVAYLSRKMAGLMDLETQVPFEEVRRIIDGAVTLTRTLALELNPPVLRDEGLNNALQWLARHMEELHGLHVDVELMEDLPLVGRDLRALTVQLVRELLFNVVKHAGTDHARLAGRRDRDRLLLVVEDDGAGFDARSTLDAPSHRDSLGLYSVEERIRLVGGILRVDSAPGAGTRVALEIPIHPEFQR